MRGRIIARWICGGAALAALATFTLDQIGTKRYAGELAAERDAARREGIPVFVPELAKPLPPADQNAAVIYESLPPYNSEDARNKAEGELYSRLGKSPTTLSAADWQAVRKTVAENAPRLRAIHKALSRPACVFHHDYQTAHPEEMLLPELAQMRNCARQLSMESLLIAHDGKGVAAVANARLGFHIADHAYSDPLLIGYLVAVAIDNITLNTMQKILLLAPNDATTVNAVIASIKDVPMRSLKPAMGGEVAFEQTMCETMRHEGFDAVAKILASENGESPPAPLPKALTVALALRRPYWSQVLDKNALAMLRLSRAVIAVCDQPYRESQPAIQRATAPLQSSRNSETFLAALLLPTETGLPHTRALTANKFGVTRAAAAVCAYRAAHGGALPAALSDAMPTTPTNAFDDTPLTYLRTPEGFTIKATDPADPSSKSTKTVFTFSAKP